MRCSYYRNFPILMRSLDQKRSKKAISPKIWKHVSAYHIVKKPVMSEKAYAQNESNKYHFFVDIRANKVDIAQSFETLYGVKPLAINTVAVYAKHRANRKVKSVTKKAIITTAQKFELL